MLSNGERESWNIPTNIGEIKYSIGNRSAGKDNGKTEAFLWKFSINSKIHVMWTFYREFPKATIKEYNIWYIANCCSLNINKIEIYLQVLVQIFGQKAINLRWENADRKKEKNFEKI